MIEYSGNDTRKRLLGIAAYPHDEMAETNQANALNYIKGKGMIVEFALDGYEKGYSVDCHDGFGKRNQCVYFDNRYQDLTEVMYGGEKYYVGYEDHQPSLGFEPTPYYCVYKELPRIYDDKIFTWKENGKHGTKETSFQQGIFEFYIICKATGDAHIQIKYTKCENRHRNKVTMADLTVRNASNETILDTIKEWKKEFKRDLNAA